ncbi:MAG: 50S ribosomal protein L22 [Planctomycetota bacterium]|jgi:large subunit ribosomal protein L22|nr:50S ribosomal protein L22 [Pirellulales bacterium]MDA0255033.1 50S ribosomal protein L22 [Planctomycetota bacterium]MDA1200300.1 50S ribosomal protein L22 [Planctomycetota bacterium]
MAFTASHKFARISPRKVRPLADLVRGKFADEALDILRYQPQRGARMLEKVIKSALGNAENQQAAGIDDLVVVDARIDPGPMFKRFRPRARGMAYEIKRRMSHIKVALDAAVPVAGDGGVE